MSDPTIQERYEHFRHNAEAFVESMKTMVAACERDVNDDLASKLKVWALMPWEAALRDDDSGDLWFTCEVCGEPIKDDASTMSDDACWFHNGCLDLPASAKPL